MYVYTPENIAGLQDGQKIESVRGVCINLEQYRTGTSKEGKPYEVQNMTLRGDSGALLKVVFMNFGGPVQGGYLNQVVYITSQADQSGNTSILKGTDTYRGANDPKVTVFKGAQIGAQDGGQAQQPQAYQPPPQMAPQATQAPPPAQYTQPPQQGQQQTGKKAGEERAILETKKVISREANAFGICLDMAILILQQRPGVYDPLKIGDDARTIAASLFIQVHKTGAPIKDLPIAQIPAADHSVYKMQVPQSSQSAPQNAPQQSSPPPPAAPPQATQAPPASTEIDETDDVPF